MLEMHPFGELQQPDLQSLALAPGTGRHETNRLPFGIHDHLEEESVPQVRVRFPAFDLVAPLGRGNAFRDDAAGTPPLIEGRNLRNILAGGCAQGVGFRFARFGRRDQRNGGDATCFQLEGILIAELAIEVVDAGNRLNQIALGCAARVDYFKECANEPTMPIGWIGRHHLRAAYLEGNALVGPGMSPPTGAGYDRTPFLAGVLNHRKISRPHEGGVAVPSGGG